MNGTSDEPDRATGRVARRRERTREAVLEACEQLLSTRPVHQVTIDEIANLADVSVGSVYGHFGSKDGVAAAVAERVGDRMAVKMLDGFEASDSPYDQLASVARAYVQFLIENPAALRYLNDTNDPGDRLQLHVEVVSKRFSTLTGLVINRLDAAVAAGQIVPLESRLAVFLGFGALTGVASLALRTDAAALTPSEVEAAVEQAIGVVVAGLRPPPTVEDRPTPE